MITGQLFLRAASNTELQVEELGGIEGYNGHLSGAGTGEK